MKMPIKIMVSCAAAITLTLFVSATGFGASSPGGDVLYANECEVCHGPIEVSSIIKGATSGMIQYAIEKNLGGMSRLSNLSMAQRHGIANALAAPPALPVASASAPDPGASLSSEELPPVTVIPTPAQAKAADPPAFGAPPKNPNGGSSSGIDLYNTRCSGCHGPLAGSTKTGATAGRILMAVNGNAGGMGYLSTLSTTDLIAISLVLGGGGDMPVASAAPSAPSSGGGTGSSATYDASCSGCHGPLASSTKTGATASRIQSAISGNVGGMGYLSSLSATDVQTIASALGGPAPVTASAPIASGVTPSSGNSGSPGMSPSSGSSGVYSSLKRVPASPAVSTASLSAASTTPPSPALTNGGAALYGSSCAACHGPLASSAKTGATAAGIQAAINGNTGGMGYLSSLPPADVQAVADALGGAGSSPTIAPASGMSGNCSSCHPNGAPKGQMGSVGVSGGGGSSDDEGGNSDDNTSHESGDDD